MTFDIEGAFDKAVYAAGGVRVTDRTGRAPPFANADYLFESRRLIAELKILKRAHRRKGFPDLSRRLEAWWNPHKNIWNRPSLR